MRAMNWSGLSPEAEALVNASPIYYPTETRGYLLALRVAVSSSALLSLLGSSLIVLSYLCFPEVRTLARQLLVNLSLADFISAAANCIGVLAYYGRFIEAAQTTSSNGSAAAIPEDWCVAQAAFAVFGAESSILWTIAVAVYMFIIVVLRRPVWAKRMAVIAYFLCWGLPAVLTLWLALDGFLGYEAGATPGFCAITGSRGSGYHNESDGFTHYPIVLGYDLWLYVAFVCLPLLYIAIHCHIKIKVTREDGRLSMSMQSLSRSHDLKLVFVPLVFMALRVWSLVVDVSIYYLPFTATSTYRGSYASAVLGVLEGIGDSGQGWANALLFCVFTRLVRQRLWAVLRCVWCRQQFTRRKWQRLEENTLHWREEAGRVGDEEEGRDLRPLTEESYSSLSPI